ncbi:hypothetical protein CAFE_17650 [Caprobacter fermentans]|uniref:Uncharacterized protein n=1 Tax=Caproicibacter fermentans TaxID=2576756 RepID=A0A6N8I0I2_9FIRM|nr:hypothetical protein [Caproicibacter fermentans]MVB11063.1 hypothetical protein [Caproicibacter fermentans]
MQTIIDGKLYDTDTATLVASSWREEIFRTRRGNWFKRVRALCSENFVLEKMNDAEAKRAVGILSPKSYETYFGRPEEA